jgi:hypothetical protein
MSLGFTLYAEVDDVAATPWRKFESLVVVVFRKLKPCTDAKRKQYLVAIFNVCISLYFIIQF